MIVVLWPEDELIVQFQDTDGEIRIHFDSETHPNAVVVEETMGYPDDEERKGILYKETFTQEIDKND